MKIEIRESISGAHITHSIFELTSGKVIRRSSLLLILIAIFTLVNPGQAVAQQGNITLFGDIKIDDSKADTPAPSTVTVILYDRSLKVVARQNVSTRGRYRFTNLRRDEDYELVVEAEEGEIARVKLNLLDPSDIGIRQDFEFEWKSKSSPVSKQMTGVISAEDLYNRSAPNKSLFQKAQEAAGKKKYEQAVTFLRQILDSDKLDFPVWTLLGTLYLVQEKVDDAEKAYLSALEAKPSYVLALLNLGRLRASKKRFDQAIEPLTRAVELRPQSGEANLLLGEAYLQIRKGSKAIPYLDEAARLGRAEAHLRLAWLYNAAGLREKAAVEYEEFLKKNPGYADRKKLEQYISANKKS
ncbi:MAG TPA: tetratricopeptide repeat protein [Pyrinomonadaceae bacterium]